MRAKNLLLLLGLAASASAASLSIGTASVGAGGSTNLNVVLANQGSQISAMQFDLIYDKSSLSISPFAGNSTTAANKDFNVTELPNGKRIIIISLFNATPIGDGTVAQLAIAVAANSAGSKPIAFANASGSSPTGAGVQLTTTNGSVNVIGSPQPALSIGTVSAAAGGTANLNVALANLGAQVSAIQFDLVYDRTQLTITPTAGAAAIAAGKQLTFTNEANGIRVVIINFQTNTPIGDGNVANLAIAVAASAPAGPKPIAFANAAVSSPGGASTTPSTTDGSVTVTAGTPALSITKSHSGAFAQGQANEIYTITVSNGTGATATTGIVSVTDTVPTGLTLVSLAGTGWTCSGSSCSRGDSLAGGSSYPPITVTVNVAGNAPGQVTNQANVSGGGSAGASASDATTITAAGTCTFSLNPSTVNIGNGSGTFAPLTGSFILTATNCTAQNTWSAVAGSPRILSISPSSGNGATASTTITFTMFTATTTIPKSYTIRLAGLTLTINQAGSFENQLQRVVRALYQTILGREPDPNGFQFWTGPGAPKDNNGVTLTNQMADGFYVSPEFADKGFVTMSIHQALQGRLPVIAEWQPEVASLRNQTTTLSDLTNSLMPAGLSTAAFVQLAIFNAFGRNATAGEVAQFTNQINFSSSTNPRLEFLVNNIFTNNEFRLRTNPQFIQTLFFTILVRDPDSGGFNFWLSQIDPPNGQPGIYFLYNPQPPTPQYRFKLAVIGQAVPPNPNLLGFLGSPEFQGLIQ